MNEQQREEQRRREQLRREEARRDEDRRRDEMRRAEDRKREAGRKENARREDEMLSSRGRKDTPASTAEQKRRFDEHRERDQAPREQEQVPRWRDEQKPARSDTARSRSKNELPGKARREISDKLRDATPDQRKELLKRVGKAQRVNEREKRYDNAYAHVITDQVAQRVGGLSLMQRTNMKIALMDRMQSERISDHLNGRRPRNTRAIALKVEKDFKREMKRGLKRGQGDQGLARPTSKLGRVAFGLAAALSDAIVGRQPSVDQQQQQRRGR